jgi:hypothetical protein
MMMVLSLPSLRAKENNNNASRRFKIHRPANNHLATPHLETLLPEKHVWLS